MYGSTKKYIVLEIDYMKKSEKAKCKLQKNHESSELKNMQT